MDDSSIGRRRAPWRLLTHLVWFTLGWMAWSALVSTPVSYTGALIDTGGVGAVRLAMVLTTARMWREFLAVGLLIAAVTALFGRLASGRERWSGTARRQVLAGLLDAAIVTLALALGIALELPSALNLPGARVMRDEPVWVGFLGIAAMLALVAIAAGTRWSTRRLGYRHLAAAVPVVALGWALVRVHPSHPEPAAATKARVLFGLDSVSRMDDVGQLRALATEHGGTWYDAAVTPGLLTNAVWTSILTSRLPSQTGVYFIFQTPDWTAVPDNLVTRARAAGLRTYSFFSDQLTTQVGTDLPFDVNASGPPGWMQATTVAVKDASWFLPAVLPHLPRLPGASTPRNQSGTYAFFLRREIQDVLAAGTSEAGSLVVGHLDYLHQPRYPGMSELDSTARRRILVAKGRAIVDRSINWQYPRNDEDPIDLYGWKLQRLQDVLASALAESRFLDPARGNSLVLLSDHGSRAGVLPDAFGEERYYGVLLVTFGLPARDPARPFSLLDVPSLVGLPAAGGDHEPVTEYTNAMPNEWGQILNTAVPLRDGGVRLARQPLVAIGERLTAFRAYTAPRGYAPASAPPTDEPPKPAIAASGADQAHKSL